MSELFADTSGWANLVDSTQPHHTLAANLYRTARQLGQKVITTNYIITDVVALLTSPLRTPRSKIIAFIESLKASPHVEIFHVDPTLDKQAWELLKNRPDKEWSLVDCSSFVLMQQRGMIEALTTDHHFEQADFVRLLK
jgi:predicted nucleic acid-binding protein